MSNAIFSPSPAREICGGLSRMIPVWEFRFFLNGDLINPGHALNGNSFFFYIQPGC